MVTATWCMGLEYTLLFDIDISEKVHNTEEVINEKISITLSVCFKTQWN